MTELILLCHEMRLAPLCGAVMWPLSVMHYLESKPSFGLRSSSNGWTLGIKDKAYLLPVKIMWMNEVDSFLPQLQHSDIAFKKKTNFAFSTV